MRKAHLALVAAAAVAALIFAAWTPERASGGRDAASPASADASD